MVIVLTFHALSYEKKKFTCERQLKYKFHLIFFKMFWSNVFLYVVECADIHSMSCYTRF